MVAMPGQLFYSTQIPVCLWFLARDKKNGLGGRGKKMRNRSGETLFIDARKLGTLIDRVHRELGDDDIARIAGHVPPLARRRRRAEVRRRRRLLQERDDRRDRRRTNSCSTPGRYVGAEEVEDDGEPFEEKMKRLVTKLEEQFAEGAKLEKAIRENLRSFVK